MASSAGLELANGRPLTCAWARRGGGVGLGGQFGCGGFMGSTLGYSLKLCNSMITASATVYNEKFMKSNDDSIHFQNLQLYFFGFLFGTSVTVTELGWDVLHFRVSNPINAINPSHPSNPTCPPSQLWCAPRHARALPLREESPERARMLGVNNSIDRCHSFKPWKRNRAIARRT